jgi:outer membrane protein assembly factor BamA
LVAGRSFAPKLEPLLSNFLGRAASGKLFGMLRMLLACLVASALLGLTLRGSSYAQAPAAAASPTGAVREIRFDGLKALTEAQAAALSGLQLGQQAGRDDLQAAANTLLQSGLFANVKFNFQTRTDGILLTFHVEEAERLPAYFDNFPWFADSELNDAIHAKLPFYNGTLPGAGGVVDQAADAIAAFLVTHGLQAAVEHQVLANPVGEGSVQEFHIEGGSLQIASVQFSDAALNSSKLVQQHLAEILGKPYSRMTIDIFLTEQVRPIFLREGRLRVKLGPPEVRLTQNPNQKLPEKIPVYVPVEPGEIYRWKGVEWKGNSALSSITLTGDLALIAGEPVDGMNLDAGWDRVRERYAHLGYLDAKVEPDMAYDDRTHTLSCSVRIEEGSPYHFGALNITGLSTSAERRLRDAWTIPQGAVFDKLIYEQFLSALQAHPSPIFKDLPLHYEHVGHWLQTDAAKFTVDVLLDFQ